MSKEALVLSKEESQLLQNVQENGTNVIQSDADVDLLFRALTKAGDQAFNAIWKIVEKDSQLCEAVTKRMQDLAKRRIEANNELTKIEIENAAKNCEAIRTCLSGPTTIEEKKLCFEELRYHTKILADANARNERVNETSMKTAQETGDKALENSKKNKGIIIAATVSGITGIGALLAYVINKNKR